jgi:hypothetical protein
MSTITDAVTKKRNESDGAGAAHGSSPETRGPRVVRVEVPKDHTVRNTLIGGLVVALVLTGLLVGGYALLDQMGAFSPRPSIESPSGTATQPPGPGTDETDVAVEPGDTTGASGQPTLPELQGIFPDRVDPIAVLNGKRVRPGAVVAGYTLKAIGEDRVTVERDGRQYELILE